jgi:hypothetical protein
MSGRDFSMSGEIPQPERRIDNDAPATMRVELIDSIFALADNTGPSERTLYNAVTGALGVIAAVNPYGTLSRRAAEHLRDADWPRVYDIILRLVREFERVGRFDEYRQVVDRILSAYGVAWEISQTGTLTRGLPEAAVAQIASAFQELATPGFEAARDLLNAADLDFNAVPRRDRDACANAFDSMEAVGRIRFGANTLGGVLNVLQVQNAMDRFTLNALRALEVIRHNHFGHGNPEPFNLSGPEVEFACVSCVAGILLLRKL